FTLDDFLEQLGQVRQLGPLDELLGMLPGANKIKGLKNAQVDEKQIGHIEAIIRSMTKLEREQPEIINASRKKRIAKGSGTTVQEINRLIKQFDDMKKRKLQLMRRKQKNLSKKCVRFRLRLTIS
ncbi:signal recognition particle protein, partial [Bacillus sp. D-CC]